MSTIDQISINNSRSFGDIDDSSSTAQTFTPAVTGNLESIRVSLYKFTIGVFTDPLVVSIETMTNEDIPHPSGIVLGSANVLATSIPPDPGFNNSVSLTTIVFSPSILLQQGVKYAITFKTNQPLFPDISFYDIKQKTLGFTNNENLKRGELYLGSGTLSGTFTSNPRFSDDIGLITVMDTPQTPFVDQFNIARFDGSQFVASLDDVAGTRKIGQTFIPSITAELEKILVTVVKNNAGSLGDLNIEIQETTAGLPNGTVIGSTTRVVGIIRPQSGATIVDSDVYEVFIPELPTLTAGTKYAIVFSAVHDDLNNYRLLGSISGNFYTPGSAVQANDGITWGELPNQDLAFAIFLRAEIEVTINLFSDAQIAPIGTHTISSQTQILEIPTRIDNVSLGAFNFSSSERITAGFSSAQSFTPSITAILNSVDLVIAKFGNASSDLFVSLETVVAGLPDGIPIVSVSFSPAALPFAGSSGVTKTSVTFSPKPIVTAGTEYAITFKSVTPISSTNYYVFYRVFNGIPPDGLMTGGKYFSKNEPNPFVAQIFIDGSIAIRLETDVNPFIDQFQMGRPRVQSAVADLNTAAGLDEIGQTFIAKEDGALLEVWFVAKQIDFGLLGDLDIEIQETTNDVPNGIVIGSTTVFKSVIPVFATEVLKIPIPQAPLLTKGIKYAMIFKSTPHDASNRYEFENIRSVTETKFADGTAVKTEDGINWFKVTGSFVDLCFATLMGVVTTVDQSITSDATITSTQTRLITSDAFAGEITTQIIFAEGVIEIEREETILTDTFVGETTIQTINANAEVNLISDQDIVSDAIIFIINEEIINSNGFIKEPLDFFATVQVNKNFEIDKNIETDVSNDIPAAPTGLVGTNTGKGDSILLTWTSPARFFNVFRKDIGPVFTKMNSLILDGVTTYEVGGLTEGVSVTFIVRAVNGLGQESPDSNES